ncbi:MAG: RNA-binding S4 domain-containing protein [Bacteroidales bacterium]|jgi:ribosome-associated heat shock protein Hsp15|nr:RNA-binding S4 domain-containing protein [Bacteroidales bacterium]
MEKLNVRIDKWLWMVRLFKTRSIATEACNAGKVKLNGENVKPSRDVRVGEVYEVHIGSLHKTVEVVGAPKSRVGAPLVPDYCTDLTPQSEYDRMKTLKTQEFRPHGLGRPTKRERRQLDFIKENYFDDEDV